MTTHPIRPARCALLWLGSLTWATASAANPLPTPPAAQQVLACLIQPERVSDLGTPVVGVVEAIAVERGDRVVKGQVLVRMRSEVERAGAEAMRSRADSEAELRGAQAAQALAQSKLTRAQDLQAQQFVSPEAVELTRTELRVAQEKVMQAQDNLRTLQRDWQVSHAQMAQRTLRSPFDGVVVERYASLGERVEDKPLLRLAAIDRLRVEVVAPISLFGRLQAGQTLNISPELPGASAREARVVQVDQVLDPASNTFRVRAELPNTQAPLPAGLRCRVELPAPRL